MMNLTAAVPDPEAEVRWRAWEARGAASDRRWATRMRRLLLLALTAVVVWLVVRLTSGVS